MNCLCIIASFYKHKIYFNYIFTKKETTQKQIEEAFHRFTNPKKDDMPVGVLLISQYVCLKKSSFFLTKKKNLFPYIKIADDIRHLLDEYDKIIPAILEIPSKDHPYEGSKDYIMQRVRKLTGSQD